MKSLAMTVLSLSVAAAASAQSEHSLRVTRNGAQPSTRGPADNFTGAVRVDARFQADAPARVGGGLITFEPGARTAWHTHPLGQTLIVAQGVGLVQLWGGVVQDIRAGDVVWIPPDAKHWHGASATQGMAHHAIAEQLDGKAVEWMEHVSDTQYRGSGR
jgi:quercetin dioxygenase-like cupin family protein